MELLPGYTHVTKAAERIAGIVRKTPLLTSAILDEITGARVFLKPENLQITGSFKFRGAYNALCQLNDKQRKCGVVACSSGNHAQGIGEAARLLGISATIVMPTDAPQIKSERVKRSGARIVTYDRSHEDRDKIAGRLCEESGAVFIHPYNNSHVIAGQGTVACEIVEQLSDIDCGLNRLLVCTGGGGLTAGIALVIPHHFPKAIIHSVEPEGFDDYSRSLEANKRVGNQQLTGSVCDAILTEKPGKLSFEINRNILAEGLAVSDEDVLNAVKFAFHELKLVVEPGGAVALAALLNSNKSWAGETIVCIISGGNIDSEVMARALCG
ncbi:MAG: threonine/serine dehydratase [Rhizobiaceae bacterium]|nr:threonine/serine dehydratase [Rhizobiaceae bacterium]